MEHGQERTDVYELLVAARAVQAEAGHAKGTVMADDGRVCMEGALCVASAFGGDLDGVTPRMLLEAHVATAGEKTWYDEEAGAAALGFMSVGEMCRWNNHSRRTLGEVLARFDRAIAEHAPLPDAAPVPDVELVPVGA